MEKPEGFKPYKYKDLKVYASREWLAEDKKKYRRVFEQSEVSYMYAEFSFYNKLFDEEPWQLACQVRAYELSGKLICSIEVDKEITPDQNVLQIREGWGNDAPGAFWKAGDYCWEVWLENRKLASQNFYVIDGGQVTPQLNPYFVIQSIRLYEADSLDAPEIDRKYYKTFDRSHTRYVWCEFKAEKLQPRKDDLHLELIFNFFSETGELKGSVHELLKVKPEEDVMQCSVGWGTEQVGSWYAGDYKLEIVFLSQVVAVTPFKVGNEFELSYDDSYYIRDTNMSLAPAFKLRPNQPDDMLRELESMIGLEVVKKSIKEYVTYLKFLKFRIEKGIEEPEQMNLHSVFIGNPGTGKTTLANMLGKIYRSMGLLSKGHVHEVDRSDLIGEFIGQTAPKVKDAIEKAKGGILFIDEAYSLARKGEDSKDFGKEVIEILVKEMTNQENNFAVIAAGYPEEMNHFLDSNPGLKSRFHKNFQFPDYTPQELIEIADYTAGKKKVNLSKDARVLLYERLVEAYRVRDKSFGNARHVNALLDASKMNMGLRLMSLPNFTHLSNEELSTILRADVQRIFEQTPELQAHIPVDEVLLKDSLRDLHHLVGLHQVKKEIDELVKLVRFYNEINKDFRTHFSLHSTFLGNPGTGKTTVARILSGIFKALGILEKGHLVECSRHHLVAGFMGQTAERTNQLIDSAIGGTLFIDEAYTLIQDKYDSYGREAIATLLKRMEDQRGQFIVIMAGYPKNMQDFLGSNPGIKSRFDRAFTFEDYDDQHLYDIALELLLDHKVMPDGTAADFLSSYFETIVHKRDNSFGNARTVRQIIEKAIKNQHLRLAHLPQEQRTSEMMRTLIYDDVREFSGQVALGVTSRIGFHTS